MPPESPLIPVEVQQYRAAANATSLIKYLWNWKQLTQHMQQTNKHSKYILREHGIIAVLLFSLGCGGG